MQPSVSLGITQNHFSCATGLSSSPFRQSLTPMSPLPFPTQRLRVYDLVEKVGINVGPWADFDGDHPASNPKFCFNWAFFDTALRLVVICLWHAETEQDASGHFQRKNYREIAAAKHRWKPSQCKRAGHMDI